MITFSASRRPQINPRRPQAAEARRPEEGREANVSTGPTTLGVVFLPERGATRLVALESLYAPEPWGGRPSAGRGAGRILQAEIRRQGYMREHSGVGRLSAAE